MRRRRRPIDKVDVLLAICVVPHRCADYILRTPELVQPIAMQTEYLYGIRNTFFGLDGLVSQGDLRIDSSSSSAISALENDPDIPGASRLSRTIDSLAETALEIPSSSFRSRATT